MITRTELNEMLDQEGISTMKIKGPPSILKQIRIRARHRGMSTSEYVLSSMGFVNLDPDAKPASGVVCKRFKDGTHVFLRHKVHCTRKYGIYRYHSMGGNVVYEVRTMPGNPDLPWDKVSPVYNSVIYDRMGRYKATYQSGQDILFIPEFIEKHV